MKSRRRERMRPAHAPAAVFLHGARVGMKTDASGREAR